MTYSDYIVYIDESGSPNLEADKTDFPVFVLACICIEKEHYADVIVPRLQKLKFKYFGHDQIIFHERDIRYQSGDFSVFCSDKKKYNAFLQDIANFVKSFDFSVGMTIVDKRKLKLQGKYFSSLAIYSSALLLTIEHLALILGEKNQRNKTVHIIAESRGKKEDAELELAFRRIVDGGPSLRSNLVRALNEFNWQILFCDKKSNSSGLQLADLIARPVGVNHLRPKQKNTAFDTIKNNPEYWTKTVS